MKIDEVLCAVKKRQIEIDFDDQEVWMDLDDISHRKEKILYEIIPLINHPHSDIENGQPEVHYHVDTRYNGAQLNGLFIVDSFSEIRVTKGKYNLKKFNLIRYSEEMKNITNVEAISKSKLKHNCIHKGKCPHRGFDISNIEPVDGIITCPLHSLKFNANTKEIINKAPAN